jgi:hypothetical protein
MEERRVRVVEIPVFNSEGLDLKSGYGHRLYCLMLSGVTPVHPAKICDLFQITSRPIPSISVPTDALITQALEAMKLFWCTDNSLILRNVKTIRNQVPTSQKTKALALHYKSHQISAVSDKTAVYRVKQTKLLNRQRNAVVLKVKAGDVYRHHFKFERFNKASRPQNTRVTLSTQLLHITDLDITLRSGPARGTMFR